MRYFWTALASILLAVLIWFYARSRDIETLEQVTVPVRVTLAGGPGQFRLQTADGGQTARVKASFTGTRAEISRLRDRLAQREVFAVHEIPRPAPDRTATQRVPVRITPGDFNRPPGVTVNLVSGEDVVEVTIVPIRRERMRVAVDDQSPQRALVKQYHIVPEAVEVEGPAELLAAHDTLRTMPVSVPPSEEGSTPVPLVTELDGQPVKVRPETVRVSAELRPRTETHPVPDVPIRVLLPEGSRFVVKPDSLEPATVSITVRGPALEQFDAERVRVFLDLTGRPLKAGLQPGERLIVHLPQGFELVGDPPKVDHYELVALPPAVPAGG